MRHHHITRDGMGFCIHHASNFTDDCDECIAEEKAKRAATHCETHDETFESVCPQCAMWKANILDQDAQEITTMPEALDPVALGVTIDWSRGIAYAPGDSVYIAPSNKDARDLGAFNKAMREQAIALSTKPEPQNADEWVEWYGGKCPVDVRLAVEILQRDGRKGVALAGWFSWGHDGGALDVIRYRLAEMKKSEETAPSAPQSALQVQEGGDHYKKLKIQPVEYIHANGLPFAEGSVIKYVTRWRDKNGIADLKKARHFLDLLIELETKATT